jgi:hypothetical protein
MKELLYPEKHKLAVLASAVIVVALTALGVYNQRTAEDAGQKVGSIEKTVEVQHTEVVQALCNQPFTSACLSRALNILRTCRADRGCARLLGTEPIVPPPRSGNEKRHNPEPGNGGSHLGPKAPGSAGPTSPNNGGGHHHGGGNGEKQPHSPPAPPGETPQSAPESAPAPGRSGEAPGKEPESPPGAKGVVPQAVESVEGIVECVPKLEIGCATQGILGAN